ncbi:MAG: helix-turn-helix domain-containing protein [Gammaproteobacteria bacterium]
MNANAAAPNAGPGQELAQARNEARLSVEDVARALQLSARHIVAIERDDYEQLPAATYVRGYLRAYAQLVGIAPERVLDRFNQLPVANRRQGLTPPAPAAQISSSDSLVKLGTLAVVGVMLGLAIVWWQGPESASAPAPALAPVAAVPEAAPPASEPASPPARPQPEPTPAPAATPEKPAERPAAAAPAPAREAPVIDIDPHAPRVRLVLYVIEESWADVRDAHGQRLIYETVPAGRVVTLAGVPPLQVFLGNAEGVRVELNGRDYDVLRHKRGQVARFTLGEATRP